MIDANLMVSTETGDRVRVQFLVPAIYFGFIEISPLSNDILRHAKQVLSDGQRTDTGRKALRHNPKHNVSAAYSSSRFRSIFLAVESPRGSGPSFVKKM